MILNQVLSGAIKTGVGLVTTAAVAVGLDHVIPSDQTKSKLEKVMVDLGKVVLGMAIVGSVTSVITSVERRKTD